jgi:hypothetical protein
MSKPTNVISILKNQEPQEDTSFDFGKVIEDNKLRKMNVAKIRQEQNRIARVNMMKKKQDQSS